MSVEVVLAAVVASVTTIAGDRLLDRWRRRHALARGIRVLEAALEAAERSGVPDPSGALALNRGLLAYAREQQKRGKR